MTGSSRPKAARPLQAMAVVSLLGACAGQGGEQILSACPPAQIAVPADRIGNNNSEGELRFVATIGELTSSCRLDQDQVEVDLAFTLNAEPGPAFDAGPVRLTYFLATVDPNRAIIDKQILDVEIDVDPASPVTGLREAVTLRLPASTEASGANYNLYVGFQPDGQARDGS